MGIVLDLRLKLEALRGGDAFAALGLAVDASGDQIRAAWQSACRAYHPHRHARDGEEASALAMEVFLELKAAHATLADPVKREALRRQLLARKKPTTMPTPPPKATMPPIERTKPITSPPGRMTTDQLEQALAASRTRKTRYEQALDLIQRKQFAAATKHLIQLVHEDPESRRYRAQLAFSRGMEAVAADLRDEAVRHLERCLSHDPNHAEAEATLTALRKRAPTGDPVRPGLIRRLFG